MTRQECLNLVDHYITSATLRKHSLAVEAIMGALADHFKEDKQLYQTVGLLHDLDWELTSRNYAKHGCLTADILKKEGLKNKAITEAILAHNYHHNGFRQPQNNLEWSLYCADELAGLIVAVALVMPNARLSEVSIEGVMRKFSQKSFAAKVNRDQIGLCQEKLNLSLEQFIGLALKAMQSVSKNLGL